MPVQPIPEGFHTRHAVPAGEGRRQADQKFLKQARSAASRSIAPTLPSGRGSCARRSPSATRR